MEEAFIVEEYKHTHTHTHTHTYTHTHTHTHTAYDRHLDKENKSTVYSEYIMSVTKMNLAINYLKISVSL